MPDLYLISHLEPQIQALLDKPPKVVLVVAPAGFGKTVFLNEFRTRASDDWQYHDENLSEKDWDKTRPLMLTCRPEAIPQCLDRLRVYGDVVEIGSDALLLDKGTLSAEEWDRTAGWPVLLHKTSQDLPGDLLARFVAFEILSDFSVENLISLVNCTCWPEELAERIPPLNAPDTEAFRRLNKVLPSAVESALLERVAQTEISQQTSQVLWNHPSIMQELLDASLKKGDFDQATELLQSFGGWYLFYQLGPEAFTDFIERFPEQEKEQHTELVLARSIVALKQGELEWCRRLLTSSFGPRFLDIYYCLSDECHLPLRVRVFRVVLFIYEDGVGSERLISAVNAFVDKISIGQHLLRGSCHNFLVDLFIRMRRYDEAQEAARRAQTAYERANASLLNFYISLHQAVLSVLRGDINAVETHIASAQKWIGQIPFESRSDQRFISYVQAVLSFDKGEAAPLLKFIESDLEDFESGEIWPTLAEIMLHFGSLALASEYNARVALDFIDHWSRMRGQSRTFRIMSEVRRARILQNANRWGEAAQVLTVVQSNFDRVWIESAESELRRLAARDQITIALTWLRQIAFEQPTFPYLTRKFDEMRLNPHLSGRQRLAIDIWAAYVARHLGNASQARSLLQSVFERIAHQQAFSSLHEENLFIDHLLTDKRIADFVKTKQSTKAVIQKFEASQTGYAASSARRVLTRKEFKVLSLLSEGASNKLIARRMDVSEPTVKFHLKNLFRKLGCGRRAEVVKAARALGWID